MTGKTVVVAVAALAIVGFAVWVFAGGGLAVLGLGKTGTAPSVGPASAPTVEGGDATAEGGGAPASRKGAVLFGSPPSQRQGVGAIAAHVLRAKDRSPVAAASVFVTGESNGGAAVSLRAATDERGVVLLKGVPAGDDYLVRVEATDKQGTWLPGVRVAPGATKDLGELLVGAKGVLSGRVVDEQGKPVRGARVAAFAGYGNFAEMMSNFLEVIATLDREPKALGEAKSDGDGRFRIEDMPTGTLLVGATAPGRTRAQREVGMTASGPASGEVTLVLEPGATVAGKVVDAEGRGIGGARLAIIHEGGDPDAFLLGRTFTTADDAGAFEATVADGSDRLRAFVAAEGYPTAYSQQFQPGQKDLRIVVQRGSTLELLVETKADHRPVEGAQVLVMVGSGADMNEPESTGTLLYATTGADGRATLAGRPGRVEMMMVSSSVGVAVGSPSKGGGGSFAMGEFDLDVPPALEAGKTQHGVVRLAGGGISMEGRVLDPQGNGIAGVSIKPFSMMGLGGSGKVVVSEADGSYRIDGLSTTFGPMLLLSAPGWVQRDSDVAAKDGKEPAKPGEVVHKDWTMVPAATVRGRVLDSAGAAVPDAHVSWSGGGSGMFLRELTGGGTTTATDGSYVLFDVDPGSDEKGTVSVSAVGFVAGKSDEVKVSAGGSATAKDVVLSRGATLRGTVFSSDGRRVAAARVEYSSHADDSFSMSSVRDAMRGHAVRTAADGSFSIATLPTGTTTLTGSADGSAAARVSVEIEGGKDPAPVELRLKQAGRVTGLVVDADGRPIGGVSVRVEGTAGDDDYVAPQRGTTAPDGTFTLPGLPLGRVKVEATAEGRVAQSVEAAVDGPSVEIRLAAVNPDDARRLAEIDKELQEITKGYLSAKTDAEREAVSKRMTDLAREKRNLEKAGVKSASPPIDETPSAPEPVEAEPAMR